MSFPIFLLENESGFALGLFEVILGYKDKHSWFWGSWTFLPGTKSHENYYIQVFLKVEVKKHLCNVEQINPTELLAFPNLEISI